MFILSVWHVLTQVTSLLPPGLILTPPEGDIPAWPWPTMEVSGGQDSGPPFPIGLAPSLRCCRKFTVSQVVAPLPQGAEGSEP